MQRLSFLFFLVFLVLVPHKGITAEPLKFILDEAILFKDLRGKSYSTDILFKKPTIIFLQGYGCPISKRQAEKVNRLTEKFYSKFNVVLVETSKFEKNVFKPNKKQIQVLDADQAVVKLLGARTTTESFLIQNNRILYRGAIDDQYNFEGIKPSARKKLLENAIASWSEKKEISVNNSTPFGCYLETGNSSASQEIFSPEDFRKNISPIVADKCLNCHSSSGAKPDLSDIKTLVQFKPMIKFVVSENLMPPWYAVGGHWRNDLRLTNDEKKQMLRWASSLQPADLPAFEKPKIHDPDESLYETTVLNLPSVNVKAEGFGGYKYVKLPLNNKEEIWIQMLEFKSTAGGAFHHAIVVAKNLDAPAREGFYNKNVFSQPVGFFTSGLDYQPFRSDAGILLSKNTTLYFQIHHEPIGTPVSDKLKVILRKFKNRPPKALTIRSLLATDKKIQIPPNTKDVRVDLEMKAGIDGTIEAAHAHMHYRGKKFLMILRSATQDPIELLKIDNFNFKMQLVYRFEEPPAVKASDIVNVSAWFDNSAENLNNPDPSQHITGGERDTDEMIFGTFFVVAPADSAETFLHDQWYKKPGVH